MKKIEYTEESRQAAAILGNLLAVRYEGSENPDREDVYRSALALTSGMGLGQVTMGQIGNVVADVVAYYSVEEAEQGSARRIKAISALTEAKRRLLDAQDAVKRAERKVAETQERPLRFTPSNFRFMR